MSHRTRSLRTLYVARVLWDGQEFCWKSTLYLLNILALFSLGYSQLRFFFLHVCIHTHSMYLLFIRESPCGLFPGPLPWNPWNPHSQILNHLLRTCSADPYRFFRHLCTICTKRVILFIRWCGSRTIFSIRLPQNAMQLHCFTQIQLFISACVINL